MYKIIFILFISECYLQKRCCEVCPEGMIKTYSFDVIFQRCGESCIKSKDFWKYKIFEPGLARAKSNDEHVCTDSKYVYEKTEKHGIPWLITVELDMYKFVEDQNQKQNITKSRNTNLLVQEK